MGAFLTRCNPGATLRADFIGSFTLAKSASAVLDLPSLGAGSWA